MGKIAIDHAWREPFNLGPFFRLSDFERGGRAKTAIEISSDFNGAFQTERGTLRAPFVFENEVEIVRSFEVSTTDPLSVLRFQAAVSTAQWNVAVSFRVPDFDLKRERLAGARHTLPFDEKTCAAVCVFVGLQDGLLPRRNARRRGVSDKNEANQNNG